MNTETVYLVSVDYKTYAFYDKKTALEAWDVLSRAYNCEFDWRVDKTYITQHPAISLRTLDVYPEEEVKKERKALEEKEKEIQE